MGRSRPLKLVSCIIPVHNGEAYLAAAIESILAQTHRCLEVIVVDNGSTDGTAEVARSFGGAISFFQQSDQGETGGRNRGLREAKGQFAAFLDADDLWLPHKLETQLERFAGQPDLTLSFSHYQNFWDPQMQNEAEAYQDHPVAGVLGGYYSGTLLTPIDSFVRFGPFRPGTTPMVWFLDALRQGAIAEILPEVLMRRRLHPDNLTRRLIHEQQFCDQVFLPILKAWLDYRRSAK